MGTAVVFALFHGVQNPWLFGSRLVFGLLAGILVWRTGGLEAAVAIHVINNLCALGLATVTGTVSDIRTMTEVGWTQGVSDVVMFGLSAVACWGIAVGMRVSTVVRDRG
jgi:membrane protease YdiL (CAAX protease family)